MSYTNYPTTEDNPQPSKPSRDNRKLIYGILIAALLGTWGYIIFDKSKTSEQITNLQTQYSDVDSARNVVQQEYNEALARMDSLTGSNTNLQKEIEARNGDIEKLKADIKSELAKKNGDLNKARGMIAQLNGKINDLLTQIEQLKAQNEQLTVSNKTLTLQRDTLASQNKSIQDTLSVAQQDRARMQDIGSTLHASNINITGIDIKGSGKEKTTTTAKKVDVFRISFQLDENRLAQSGEKTLYVCVYGPDGQPITMPTGGSGTFLTRDEGEKVYTNVVKVDYEQGKPAAVSFDWKPEAGRYQTGVYKIQIFQNGYKIGEGTKSLKKGGLFG